MAMFFNSKKLEDDMTKCIQESHKDTERIVREKYNGDEDKYWRNLDAKYKKEADEAVRLDFDIMFAASVLDMDPSNVVNCMKQHFDNDRLQQLNHQLSSFDKNRYAYPGGYDAFRKDVANGYFGQDILKEERIVDWLNETNG